MEKVIRKAQEVGAVVLIDEAYHYFYDKTFLPYALKEDNVIVIRTFSKLMSIAACRLGITISNPEIIHYIKNGKLTFDANSIALLFAERIIEQPEMVETLIRIEKEGKAYILNSLKEHGYWCRDCRGNFIFLEPKHDAHEITRKLADRDVLVHDYGNELLNKYIRVSVGSVSSMREFLEVFYEVDGEQ